MSVGGRPPEDNFGAALIEVGSERTTRCFRSPALVRKINKEACDSVGE